MSKNKKNEKHFFNCDYKLFILIVEFVTFCAVIFKIN